VLVTFVLIPWWCGLASLGFSLFLGSVSSLSSSMAAVQCGSFSDHLRVDVGGEVLGIGQGKP
jgi:hypothetical protein